MARQRTELQNVHVSIPPSVLELVQKFKASIDVSGIGVDGVIQPAQTPIVLGAALVLILAWLKDQSGLDQAKLMSMSLHDFTTTVWESLAETQPEDSKADCVILPYDAKTKH